jgi:predicted HD phosphohydrolase
VTSFARLSDATVADWLEIEAVERQVQAERNAGEGLLRLLRMQRDDPKDGWPINIYDHCLQSATLAHQAGADEELVFCALFHDAAELISPHHHDQVIARLVEPYVSQERCWMIEHHAAFQNRHAVNHPFRDKKEFERFRGHPAFQATADFCERFDAEAFDPSFEAMPLEAFEPIVDRICRPHLPRPGGA